MSEQRKKDGQRRVGNRGRKLGRMEDKIGNNVAILSATAYTYF